MVGACARHVRRRSCEFVDPYPDDTQVVRTERGSDHLLSTLKRYVEALGGEVEVVAHVAGRTVKLRGG